MKRIYKKMTVLLLLCALLLTGCGGKDNGPGTPAPAPAPDAGEAELAALRQQLQAEGAAMGVAYLGGYFDEEDPDLQDTLAARGLLEEFPFLKEIDETDDTFIRHEGFELYLILPAHEDYTVTVTACELVEGEYEMYVQDTEELYWDNSGAPLLVRCNYSDLFGNCGVTVETADEQVYYSPCLNLMDGSLLTAYGVCDITPYDLTDGYQSGFTSEYAFTGSWYTPVQTADGEIIMALHLQPDGSAEYCYGYAFSEVIEGFAGEWYADDSSLELQLEGGPAGESYSLNSYFYWQLEDGTLRLEHTGGDVLLYDTDGWTFFFTDIDPQLMATVWVTYEVSDETGETWYTDLQLNMDHTAYYTVYDASGSFGTARYYGSWNMGGNVLDISMELDLDETNGASLEQYVEGSYRVMQVSHEQLELERITGSYLTGYMEYCGYEYFNNYYYE